MDYIFCFVGVEMDLCYINRYRININNLKNLSNFKLELNKR